MKRQFKGTPGPWIVPPASQTKVIDGHSRIIAVAHQAVPSNRNLPSKEQAAANAVAIKAVPDMIKALIEMREKYGRLHDFVSDAIEGGRLTEDDIPDDYQAIVRQLYLCASADHSSQAALNKALGEEESDG